MPTRLEPPRIIFISCSKRELWNPIANALSNKLPAAMFRPFEAPLHDAVSGMFFYCEPGAHAGTYGKQLPYPPRDAALLFPKLERALKEHFGDEILAKISHDFIREDTEFLDNLIIPDSFTRIDEMRYVARAVGVQYCTCVAISGPRLHIAHGVDSFSFPMTSQHYTDPDFGSEMHLLASKLSPSPSSPRLALVPEVETKDTP